MKKCDIVIPVWNELESTRECIESVKKFTHHPYHLIIIDNGSLEPTRIYLDRLVEESDNLQLLRNEHNLGFVKAINQGIAHSKAPYVCLLNNDAYVTDNWLMFLIETIESGSDDMGIANPTSNVFGKSRPDGKRKEWQELESCRGFCMLIKREILEKIVCFDEVYGMGYFEEKDFCKRAQKIGYRSIRSKASFVFHKDRLSFDKIEDRENIFEKNKQRFVAKWGRQLRVAYVLYPEKDKEAAGRISLCINRIVKLGHQAWIFTSGGSKEKLRLIDHEGIRFFIYPRLFFSLIALYKLWKKKEKKRLDVILTNSDAGYRFFRLFKNILNAEVTLEKEISMVEKSLQSISFAIYDKHERP
ncbi:MAG: glycosyltransferase family 2 protein [Candidatus Omnitrophota bacterium]